MVARFQRILALGVLGLSFAWLAAFWSRSSSLAVAGFLCILFSYSAVLALQFALLRVVNRRDSAALATPRQLVWAWLVETLVAARVFLWWQPFRSNAFADHGEPFAGASGQRGVVFLHGFVCNRGVWTLWFRTLRSRGIPYVALNLEPVFGAIDDYTASVDDAIRGLRQTTGKPPLLVCHSMGGLVARAWLRASGGDDLVHHVVTIGSPHRGTVIGHLGPRAPRVVNGEQMRFQSRWLAALEGQEPPARARRFTCFYSNCDNIVLPTSTATMSGADNRFVPGVPHVALALDRRVIEQSLALL